MVFLLCGSSSSSSSSSSKKNGRLLDACRRGDLPAVQKRLRQGARIDCESAMGGDSPLHVALAAGHVEVASYLILFARQQQRQGSGSPTTTTTTTTSTANWCVATRRNRRGWLPLHVAARYGHGGAAIVPQLWQHLWMDNDAANNNKNNAYDYCRATETLDTPLHLACAHGHLHVVQQLLLLLPPPPPPPAARLDDEGNDDDDDDDRLRQHVVRCCCARNVQGYTPLHVAAQNGHLSVVRHLLVSLASASRSSSSRTRKEVTDENEKIIEEEKEKDDGDPTARTTFDMVDWQSVWGETALYLAAKGGHEAVVDALMQYCDDDDDFSDFGGPNDTAAVRMTMMMCDQQEKTPLHVAAEHGHVGVAKRLLLANDDSQEEQGVLVDPNALDVHNRTPLYWASRNGHLETVLLLCLEHGARIDLGKSPLYGASTFGHTAILEFLCQHQPQQKQQQQQPLEDNSDQEETRAATTARDEKGSSNNSYDIVDREIIHPGLRQERTPLHMAAQQGQLYALRFLTQQGGSIHASDPRGFTPLHYAADGGHVTMIEWILEESRAQGGDPMLLVDALTNQGHRALDLARQKNYTKAARVLEKAHIRQLLGSGHVEQAESRRPRQGHDENAVTSNTGGAMDTQDPLVPRNLVSHPSEPLDSTGHSDTDDDEEPRREVMYTE